MALFSFGKKDKNPPEVSAPVAKALPTPPKIQNPPGTGSFPAVKPPQPTGLMPGVMPAGSVMTQPMAMPRTGMTGLKPSRPGLGQSTRPTQRIVLPTPPGTRPNSTKPLTMGTPGGRINLPIGMILRCLPPEVLAADISEFEASGRAATEIGLPMNMILGQLPSGKVEMALQDLVPHFPAGYLQPTESIANYLPTMVSLPLMDVVMRIPPDLLALRPDQKDVDAAVINMADPFTEEILREQAESARRQSQPNIIEESQAPQEEFVPRDQAATSKSIAPPRRPAAEPMVPSRTLAATTLAAPPMPPVTKLPTPGTPMKPRTGSISVPTIPAPTIPTPSARNASSSGHLPTPSRATGPIPLRLQVTPTDAAATAPVPPVPRHTGPIPAPPPPRHTTSLPVPRRTGSLSGVAPATSAATEVAAPAAGTPPPQPPADDLQRLAALAMAQMGETSEVVAETAPAVGVAALAMAAVAAEEAPVGTPVEEPAAVETPEIAPQAEEATPESAAVAAREPELAPAPDPVVETPAPVAAHAVPEAAPTEPASAAAPEDAAESSAMAFNLNTCTADDLVKNIPGCFPELAESIIKYRTKIGSFKRIEELLDVPGITKEAYINLTGEAPPDNRVALTLNELLGFPADQDVSLKDVTDRISCWPDVTGCVLSQSSGLSLVGTAPAGVDKAAVVAFAPRMFESLNKSFSEVSGQETDALVIPSTGTSFHLFRNRDLYLIIMSRLPQMPERHVKVARLALAELSTRRD
jgi:competence ComEA-like helix-hairpin-helix protein